MARFSRNFWVYWTGGMVWSLGLMAFFLVYNLYLVDLGFNEAMVGRVSAAFTLGSLAATLPTGWLLSQFGPKRTILASAGLTGLTLLGRVIFISPQLIQSMAFVNGISIGAWIVSAPPFITHSTAPQARSWAFSLWHGASIGTGVLAGLLIGLFSGKSRYLLGGGFSVLPVDKKTLLIASSTVALVATLVLLFLKEVRLDGPIASASLKQARKGLFNPSSRSFIWRMMVVLFLWSTFVGSFPPFFNVFFYSHYHLPLSNIGWIFSLSQLFQISAVFCMPMVVSRLGRSKAIPTTQLLSALVLPVLGLTPHVMVVGTLYVVYLCFQVMTEPALENFIMDSVSEEDRPKISSLRYLTLFLVQAIAVWLSGLAIARFGYSMVLPVIALVGCAASVSFYTLLHLNPGRRISTDLESKISGVQKVVAAGDLPIERWDYMLLKRMLDLILAGLLLVLVSPLMALLALLVRLTTPGSVFFRQERVGLNGNTFLILKFRTMLPFSAEVSDTWWTRPGDKRVTFVGRFLRKTSLDELPQLFNVMRGDMSLVGPRPERPHYVALFRRSIPDYTKRLYVKCGMTGWAQVNGWRGDTSIEKRIEYDLFYLKNWNLWFDIKILLLTLRRGFYHRNAY
jgi:exopolysaccharide biosynthesis polyprenyl glycosylphosphotransferase